MVTTGITVSVFSTGSAFPVASVIATVSVGSAGAVVSVSARAVMGARHSTMHSAARNTANIFFIQFSPFASLGTRLHFLSRFRRRP